eukprot:ctg_3596.g566
MAPGYVSRGEARLPAAIAEGDEEVAASVDEPSDSGSRWAVGADEVPGPAPAWWTEAYRAGLVDKVWVVPADRGAVNQTGSVHGRVAVSEAEDAAAVLPPVPDGYRLGGSSVAAWQGAGAVSQCGRRPAGRHQTHPVRAHGVLDRPVLAGAPKGARRHRQDAAAAVRAVAAAGACARGTGAVPLQRPWRAQTDLQRRGVGVQQELHPVHSGQPVRSADVAGCTGAVRVRLSGGRIGGELVPPVCRTARARSTVAGCGRGQRRQHGTVAAGRLARGGHRVGRIPHRDRLAQGLHPAGRMPGTRAAAHLAGIPGRSVHRLPHHPHQGGAALECTALAGEERHPGHDRPHSRPPQRPQDAAWRAELDIYGHHRHHRVERVSAADLQEALSTGPAGGQSVSQFSAGRAGDAQRQLHAGVVSGADAHAQPPTVASVGLLGRAVSGAVAGAVGVVVVVGG